MQLLKTIGLLILAGILGIIAMIIYNTAPRMAPAQAPVITTFEECAAAGNAVMESYPRQCNTPDGRHFVEDLGDGSVSSEAPISANRCAVAGCSQQLCVSAEEASTIVTTCEFRNEYICYAEASCEPQADGQCGWTQTPVLQQCLANPPALEGGFEGELQVQ